MSLYETNFTGLDWAIVAIYLGSSIFIGLWANRYVGGLSDYLVAGRTLRIRLALATMTGTELGLVTVMYSSELGFRQQYASLYLAIYEFVTLLIVGLTGFIVYRLRQTAVLTIPEYYEQRYTRGVRIVGACMMVISGVLNMGLFLKAGAEFLTAISGFSDPLYLKLIMTALLLLVLFYTVLGGMVSVVITDLIQFIVLGIGMLVVSSFVLYEIGFDGFGKVVTQHEGSYNPIESPGPITLVSQAAVLFAAVILWPAGASRMLSVRSSEVAQKLYLYSTIPFLSRRALPALWGIGAFAFFASQPEMQAAFSAAIADENSSTTTLSAMPLFLAKIIPTGLLGIVTAGMVAAFMSTHDSYLLCWSGVITQDIVAPIAGELTDKARINVTRVAIVLIGAALLFWGLWYEVSTDLWQYMSVTGTVYVAGVFPVVAGGLYWKRSSSVGAYIALLGGLMGLWAMTPGIKFLNSLEVVKSIGIEITDGHMMLVTFTTTITGFVFGSILFPDPPRESDENNGA
ncbi:MAG: hypothetical protein CMJ78_21715 [Planctomycetaceae bacterium]|nr:hypothetical protein [Planctomycetaceae bacterium]